MPYRAPQHSEQATAQFARMIREAPAPKTESTITVQHLHCIYCNRRTPHNPADVTAESLLWINIGDPWACRVCGTLVAMTQ